MKNIAICLMLLIFVFSGWGETAVPYQIESFDDYANSGWVEGYNTGFDSQETLIVHDGTGSLKADYSDPAWDDNWSMAFTKVFSPSYINMAPADERELAIWVHNDRVGTERLNQIIIWDKDNNIARYTVPQTAETGWQQVVAPLTEFAPGGDPLDLSQIMRIQLWCNTHPTQGGPLYLDHLVLQAYTPPADPGLLADFEDFVADGWVDTRGTSIVLQENPPEGAAVGDGCMRIKYEDRTEDLWDVVPRKDFGGIDIPAITGLPNDKTAVTFYVWSDLVGSARVNQLIMYDGNGFTARFSPPPAAQPGWRKVQARLDKFVIDNDEAFDFTDVRTIDFWVSTYSDPGNSIYIDELRVEEWVPSCQVTDAALVEAVYATPTIDADPSDWASLGSEIIEMDLAAVATDNGNLHAQYRLAWDETYLYVLIEELPGDGVASEADCLNGCLYEINDGAGGDIYYDGLSLFFDFDDSGVGAGAGPIDIWLNFGFSSSGASDLLLAWSNGEWGPHKPTAVANASTATSGTLGSRIIESRIMWQDLADELDDSREPEGGLMSVVGPGMTFGCDPRLNDLEIDWNYTAEAGAAWFNGQTWSPVSGYDAYSIDITLTYGTCAQVIAGGYGLPGDLDIDCAVGISDLEILVSEWLTAGTEADIVDDGSVDFKDFVQMAIDWLMCNDPENMDCVPNWPVYEPCIIE
jgi:hypothetical protein